MPEEDSDGFEPDEDDAPEELDLSADERRLVTQPYDYSVSQLVREVELDKILLIEVPYQREYIWDDAKASRLIESLLLNVPIPVCYFAENDDGSWEVIDGLQRCHTIARFINGEFALRGLSVLTELNGHSFTEMSGRDQRRIETRTIRCVVVTEESHPDIKFDVFERLNTGAVKLTPQELRNCIYRGTFNDGLRSAANNRNFRASLGRPKDPRMRDEEMVLRFLALTSSLSSYKPPLSQYLNEHMRDNRTSPIKPARLRLFTSTMSTINDVLGETAFRMIRDGDFSRNLNRALFDACAVSFAFADRSAAKRKASKVHDGHRQLIESEEFAPLVGRATADRSRMHGRVRMYSEMMTELGIKTTLPRLPEA